jgi:hypothetical protein
VWSVGVKQGLSKAIYPKHRRRQPDAGVRRSGNVLCDVKAKAWNVPLAQLLSVVSRVVRSSIPAISRTAS